jgi:uncharacterized protein (DUF1810 family)
VRVDDPFDLQRFVAAQDADDMYASALRELRTGRKRTHWMWFVLPQVAGLGRTATAQHFALADLDEARDYLAHPVLGPRLLECAAVLADLPGTDAEAVLGATDAMKLRSSMTLFARAATDPDQRAVFRAVLERWFDGEDDPLTLQLI